jgi:hypothetical protein
MIGGLGVEVTLRMPPARVGTGSVAGDFFGSRERDTAAGDPVPVTAMLFNDLSTARLSGVAAEPATRLGAPATELAAVLYVRLPDVLLDAAEPQGPTLFDQCRRVEYAGSTFEVAGTERTGLPGIEPYLLIVSLKRGAP